MVFHNRRLSFAQSLILFLKEKKKLSFAEIARLLAREQKTVWTQYSQACSKLGTSFYSYPETLISIPIEALRDRKLGMMEAAVLHLKKAGLRNKEIASAIRRSERTVSSLLVRAAKRGDAR